MRYEFISIIIFSSIISVIGTMIGAFIGISIKNTTNRWLGRAIGFAAGLMFVISIFDLIPEAVEKNGFFKTVIFSLIGILSVLLINNISNHYGDSKNNHIKVAFMVALGVMLHNFPEGVIMGFGFVAGDNLGIKMSVLIAIHDIPEGIAIAAPLLVSKVKTSKIILYTFITALPTVIGAWIGIFVGRISTYVLGSSLALAAGVMLYVVCGEMIPEAKKLSGKEISTFGILVGIVFGIIMITGL